MLAAGDGGRLGPHTETTPKPLVDLHGKPLAGYTLDALRACGVEEVVVVTGYREEQVVAGLAAHRNGWPELRFVSNPAFHEGASYSLRAAREAAGDEPFLLVMSDHLLSHGLLAALLDAAAAAPWRTFVATDFAAKEPRYADEATRVCTDGGARVTAIGKHLAACAGFDTGAFWVDPSAWAAIDRAPADCELSALLRPLVEDRALFAADVSGHFWYDVDTVEDLETASALLAADALVAGEGTGCGAAR
ncbi:MAG: NTP transferase domain-containing protein [Dehalococcoidia bacterium]|nr:NTP transferase domain-containing protein [Dehalococcoidia bacterium]